METRTPSRRARSTSLLSEHRRRLDGRVLVAAGKGFGNRKGVAYLVHPGLHGPLVAPLVEHESGVDGAGPAVHGGHHLLGAGHLGHPLGVDEACRLYPRDARRREPVAELGPHRRGEGLVLVLQAVAGSDVHYLHAHQTMPLSPQPFQLLAAQSQYLPVDLVVVLAELRAGPADLARGLGEARDDVLHRERPDLRVLDLDDVSRGRRTARPRACPPR